MNGLYAYFAYGSNLLPERLFQRCPTAVAYAPAILPNYRLTERLYADVDYAPGEQVHGFVYLLRANDVARLDRYEVKSLGYSFNEGWRRWEKKCCPSKYPTVSQLEQFWKEMKDSMIAIKRRKEELELN